MEANMNRIYGDQNNNRPMKEKRMNKDGDNVTDSEDDHDKRKRSAVISGSSSMKKGSGGGCGGTMRSCQAERCSADLSGAKTYHRRHKVCEHHAKAQAVLVAGVRQRFCQQCSRFHELSEFDDSKRSCRRRLAGHNERRRKNFADINSQIAEGSTSSRSKADAGQVDDHRGGRVQFNVQENANYKHFQLN